MATIKHIFKGESLSILFAFPVDYDMTRIQSHGIWIGGTEFPGVIIGQGIELKLTSLQTDLMSGNQRVSLWLDDSQLGVRKPYVGDLAVGNTNALPDNESTSEVYDVIVNVDISVTSIEAGDLMFNYVKGDKGDPLTYDDLTPEQKAELQQPATDAIASIQEVELAVETAEGLRQQAELNRQTNTSTAIFNAEQATDDANDAAILANEKAGLADQKAILANEKAGLAATATTQANAARDEANTAAAFANSALSIAPHIFEGYGNLPAGIETLIPGTSFTPVLNLRPVNVQVFYDGTLKEVAARYVVNGDNYDVYLTSDVDLFGAEITILGSLLKLLSPSNLVAEVISDTQINLTFTPPDLIADGYKIERSEDGVIFAEIAVSAVAEYSDSLLVAGTIYYYRVRAYKGGYLSKYSDSIEVCTSIDSILTDGNTYVLHDISDVSKIVKDGNDDVTRVNPTIGVNHLTSLYKPAAIPKWIDGEGIYFNGAEGDFLRTSADATLVQPTTLYVVLNLKTWQSGRALIYGGNSTSFEVLLSGNSPLLRIKAGGTYSKSYNINLNKWVLLRITLNGANSKFQINNRYPIAGDWGNASPAGVCFAGNNSTTSNSDMSLIYNLMRKVADSDVVNQQITNFIMSKFKSKVDVIPDTHPLTSICHVGDSLTYLMGQANKFNEFSDDYALALPGVGVPEMVAKWNTLTYSLQTSYKYIFVMAGSNHYLDSMPNFSTVYQAFVNQLKLDAPQAKLIICTIPPCRGNVNWTEPRYLNWLLFNEAIMGQGTNPITGADGVCYLHTSDLGDENDYLLPAYDISDHLHLNDAGYTIVANRMKEFII